MTKCVIPHPYTGINRWNKTEEQYKTWMMKNGKKQ